MNRIAAGVDSPIFFRRHEGVRWPRGGHQARLLGDAVRRDPRHVSAGPHRLRFLYYVGGHDATECLAHRIYLRPRGSEFGAGESSLSFIVKLNDSI